MSSLRNRWGQSGDVLGRLRQENHQILETCTAVSRFVLEMYQKSVFSLAVTSLLAYLSPTTTKVAQQGLCTCRCPVFCQEVSRYLCGAAGPGEGRSVGQLLSWFQILYRKCITNLAN